MGDLRDAEERFRAQFNGGAAAPAPDTAAQLASEILGIAGDPIVGVSRHSAHPDAPITVRLESGRKLHWERQRELLQPDSLVMPVVLAEGLSAPGAPLKKGQALACAKALANLAETFEQHDERAEMDALVDSFVANRNVMERRMGDDSGFRRALIDLQAFKAIASSEHYDIPDWKVTPVLLDLDSGTRYVRTLDVADYIRKGKRIQISWPNLSARLAAVGWTRFEVEIWVPEATPREHQHKIKVRTYRNQPVGEAV